jgi:hypothetical protein
MKFFFTFLLITIFFFSCSKKEQSEEGNTKTLKTQDEINYEAIGDSVINASQQLLVSQLLQQIENNGIERAVSYCYVNADSLIKANLSGQVVSIQRLTKRNRNPDNLIQTETDNKVYEMFAENKKMTNYQAIFNDQVHYYKPIYLGMPTCLSCHGGKEDIPAEVLNQIETLYPKDNAKDYEIGDFRAIWKVVMD